MPNWIVWKARWTASPKLAEVAAEHPSQYRVDTPGARVVKKSECLFHGSKEDANAMHLALVESWHTEVKDNRDAAMRRGIRDEKIVIQWKGRRT